MEARTNENTTGEHKMKKQMMTLAGVLAVSSICLLSSGCTDATIKNFQSLGNDHRVEMYSGGQKVREWMSTGYVESSTDSDGYYFTDAESKKLIKVSGDVVITTL